MWDAGPFCYDGTNCCGQLVGTAGPWPGLLPGPASCRGCQPAVMALGLGVAGCMDKDVWG